MKIATYNIWNSDRGMPLRMQQIIDEIKTVNADVFCLQEVDGEAYKKIASELDEYEHNYYNNSDTGCDGLLILSKYPILTKRYTKCAVFITFEHEYKTYLVVNLHLPSDNITQEEQFIIDILKDISGIYTDHAILAGDFNCSDKSSVHHFLTGQRTLFGYEANPPWYDLAEVHADITYSKPENTLDLRNNPRWKGKNYTYTSARLDRIYIRDAFPKTPPLLESLSLFGKDIDEESGYCSSDHYGVVVDIALE